MRRLIDELHLGPFSIGLFEQEGPLDEEDSLAVWDATEHTITLNAGLKGKTRWSVLLHELVHAISDLYDLGIDTEANASTLANGLLQALADYVKPPPQARPAVMDDDKTPEVAITPITRKEQMPP